MTAVLRLWTAIMAPWTFTQSQSQQQQQQQQLGAAWTNYVAGMAPFYLMLMEHFAVFVCRRVQVHPSDALSRAERGLAPLAALGEPCLNVLRDMEASHNAVVAGVSLPAAAGSGLGQLLAVTLTDWEGPAAQGSDAGHMLDVASPRTPPSMHHAGGCAISRAPSGWTAAADQGHPGTPAGAVTAPPPPRLLCVLDNTAHAGVGQWLAWAVARYDERCDPSSSGSGHHHLHSGLPRRPDTRTRLVNAIWTAMHVKVPPPVSKQQQQAAAARSEDAAAQRAERLGRPGIASRMWADQDLASADARSRARDTMAWADAPIASFEVPFLVRPCVAVSHCMNSALGLTGAPGSSIPPWVDALPVSDSKKAAIAQWRVNLRPLAETTTLGWLAAIWLAHRIMSWLGAALANV